MKKIKIFKFNKIAALAIIVSVSGSGSTAYAITSSNNKSLNTITTNSQHYRKSIDRLSSTGTVTKNEETIISNLFTNYKSSISKAIKDNFSYKLDILINLGTITELQKEEIINLYTTSKTNSDDFITFDQLVTSKILTKNQEKIILNSFMHCKESTSKAINDILLSKLDKLISAGTINKVQRAAVINLTEISKN